jgi:S1-C subfamily serine protease
MINFIAGSYAPRMKLRKWSVSVEDKRRINRSTILHSPKDIVARDRLIQSQPFALAATYVRRQIRSMRIPGLRRMHTKVTCCRRSELWLLILFAASVNIIAAVPEATETPATKTSPEQSVSSPSPEATISSAVENSVVKVFSTASYPDVYRPWSKQAPTEVTASGVVIAGKRILTNAHVVLYASQIQIQANQAGDKISASVEAVAPGIDLALLRLDDEKFFDSHRPLSQAKALPEIKDAVMVYGYPTGGTSLSITKGIVSRIEFTQFNTSVSGLRIQIDAAINPGNSGGPVVVDDKMIGVAFSHLGGAESIGYIIPSEEIDLFLEDIADGRYDGKPGMYDDFQTFENPALRSFLRLDKSVQGIVVHRPYSTDPNYSLKEWDVITKIGDASVDDQGMIKLGPNLRVRFAYYAQKVAKDGKVPLTIVRSGKEMHIELATLRKRQLVVPELEGTYPSYFVYGPLVFANATAEFTAGFSKLPPNAKTTNVFLLMGFAGNPLITRSGDKPAFPDERLVVVSSPLFPHRLSQGYSNPTTQVVKTVNGIAIRNLVHLVEVLRDLKDDFVRFEFNSRGGETLVFPRADMVAATDQILTDNGVRAQGTPDVLKTWSVKPAP